MNRYERWNTLLDMLAEDGQLDIEQTATRIGVSGATIRRDFDELATQQLLVRTRGGAAASTVAYDLPLRYKVARHAPEKRGIATAAAAMVGIGATIGLNGGTTTTEIGRALALKADLATDHRPPLLTVVTNALNIAHELIVRPRVRVVTTGGVARARSYELIGPIAADMLATVALDIAFLGVDGIDARHGASTHNDDEAAINRMMARQADRTVLVADGSKVGHRAFARICALADIDTLITDGSAKPAEVNRLREAGLTVIVT